MPRCWAWRPAADGLTPVEQETTSESLEELLSTILWPPEVAGCAVVLEAMTVPPDAGDVPDDAEAAAEYAASHPQREEARIVAGVAALRRELLRDPSART